MHSAHSLTVWLFYPGGANWIRFVGLVRLLWVGMIINVVNAIFEVWQEIILRYILLLFHHTQRTHKHCLVLIVKAFPILMVIIRISHSVEERMGVLSLEQVLNRSFVKFIVFLNNLLCRQRLLVWTIPWVKGRHWQIVDWIVGIDLFAVNRICWLKELYDTLIWFLHHLLNAWFTPLLACFPYTNPFIKSNVIRLCLFEHVPF